MRQGYFFSYRKTFKVLERTADLTIFVKMPKNMKNSILFTMLMSALTLVSLEAQNTTITSQAQLPKVFQLGGNEQAYEALTQEYPQTLLGVCNNDMKVAFDKWLEMMKALESYAGRINFDIKGMKVRLHVFWDTKGNIEHIGYVFRPNSRNARAEEFNAFLSSFIRQYTFPIEAQQKYSHYTIATFPTFSERSE